MTWLTELCVVIDKDYWYYFVSSIESESAAIDVTKLFNAMLKARDRFGDCRAFINCNITQQFDGVRLVNFNTRYQFDIDLDSTLDGVKGLVDRTLSSPPEKKQKKKKDAVEQVQHQRVEAPVEREDIMTKVERWNRMQRNMRGENV